MNTTLQKNLAFLATQPSQPLSGIMRGVEKESLRVTPKGQLATTSHPKQLGSALTHPSITTDFSEALLEFITAPSTSVTTILEKLEDIHSYVYQHIGDEVLWGHSMPCMLGVDDDIPVAHYGNSNIGKMKTVYRVGLGNRYGRQMQTIAGIHYNFSIPDTCWELLQEQRGSNLSLQDFKTEQYLGLIRNFRRHFWLLLYLFGSAPAVCRSFIGNRQHQLVPVGDDKHSLHSPFATSLRMGDLGYQSDTQRKLAVCYNSLDKYIDTLHGALTETHPDYQAIGIKDSESNYHQLNSNLLQIENEFYSTIRPKRTAQSGQAPLAALQSQGIEYIEVRCLDLDPYSPIGITAEQIHFLDTFLVYCLLSDSPFADEKEHQQITDNHHQTVYRGRDPELLLHNHGSQKPLPELAEQMFRDMEPVADLLDNQQQCSTHRAALKQFQQRLHNPSLTPSARLIADMQQSGNTYFQVAMDHAHHNRNYFKQRPISETTLAEFQAQAKQSLAKQQQIEAADNLSFEQYLENFFSQYQAL